MRNAILAWVAESTASRASLATVVIRLALVAFLVAFALIVLRDAGAHGSDATSASSGEVQFSGAIVAPTSSHAAADAQRASALPAGQIIRRGSTDHEERDPRRTVVVLPPREAGARVVLISYD